MLVYKENQHRPGKTTRASIRPIREGNGSSAKEVNPAPTGQGTLIKSVRPRVASEEKSLVTRWARTGKIDWVLKNVMMYAINLSNKIKLLRATDLFVGTLLTFGGLSLQILLWNFPFLSNAPKCKDKGISVIINIHSFEKGYWMFRYSVSKIHHLMSKFAKQLDSIFYN